MTRLVRRRGLFGTLFFWSFILFNLVMGYGTIAACTRTAPTAMQTPGGTIGLGLGVSFLILVWILGVVILGILALLTRGRVTVVEDRRRSRLNF